MADPILRQRLERGDFILAPGVQDMITAVIARDIGFDAIYGTGYWLTASAYGLPDAGIASVTQMTDRMATLVASSTAPVIADADTGYGGLLNVHHTTRAYEAAGVSAIQIEDQEVPKKCGHTPYKRIVPIEDMVRKVQVACQARASTDMLVVARTDAMQSEGLDGVRRRMDAYAKAGADVLFPEALTSEADMRAFCAEHDRPVLANMASGGVTPILDIARLREIGFSVAIFPALASLVSAAAVQQALRRLKADGVGDGGGQALFDFNGFCRLIGFEDVWAFERRWNDTVA
jgi:2-methylisocitrate lyase-like PEP mutase family enzyme